MDNLINAAWALRWIILLAVLVCTLYATLPKHPNQ